MKKHTMVLALFLVLSPALAGCASAKYPRYYTLNLPPAPDPPAMERFRASIAVRQFQSPGYLRQGPIVYRPTSEQIGFYEYHRWATDPRTVVTSSVLDHLRASGHFSLVSTYDGRPDTEYVLSGKLEKLEEVDEPTGVKVEVALSAQLTRVSTGVTVWSNAVSECAKVSQRNVPGVVSQMNRTMDIAIKKLLSTAPVQLASSKF